MDAISEASSEEEENEVQTTTDVPSTQTLDESDDDAADFDPS